MRGETARKLEIMRLLIIVPIVILYLQQVGILVSSIVLVGAVLYMLGSVLWLTFAPLEPKKIVLNQ